MRNHPLLGPRVARYPTSVNPGHVVFHVAVGPVISVVGALLGTWEGSATAVFAGAAAGVIYLLVAIVLLVRNSSAYLDLHSRGVVVGRRLLSLSRREMWFSEIHPASIRVWADIDAIRSGRARVIDRHWHFTGGADLAVSFLGPARHSRIHAPTAPPREPAPGRGLVVFGSQAAPEIAEEIRAGLERSGCPPENARWSEQFGIQAASGDLMANGGDIPGRYRNWTP